MDKLDELLARAKAERQMAPHARTIERLEDLRHDAQVDGDPFNEMSAEMLMKVIEMPGVREPDAVFLEDNGDLRAMWKTEDGRLCIDLPVVGSARCVRIFARGHSTWWAQDMEEVAAAARSAKLT